MEVFVHEGSTREQAMAELAHLYRLIADRWPEMIDDDRGPKVARDRAAELAAKQSGGTPALTAPPHAGKQVGGLAGAATAAA